MPVPLLETVHLKKSYGAFDAVKDISFAVNPGECLGLLGPNGAGKTTTLSMITGLVTPTDGEVRIEGRHLTSDVDPIKNRIGLVPQELALYEELPALDNLRFFGSLYNLEPARLEPAMKAALELVGLAERAKDKVKTFSGGMKRRLNLAAALLHDPQLLLMDEPTVGVDPQSRNAIFTNIESLRARGKTIIYTTHYMEEVERLCDRIVIMDHGRIIADDTLAGLKRRAAGGCRLHIELAETNDHAWLDQLRGLPGVQAAEINGKHLLVTLQELAGGSASVLALLGEHRQPVVHFNSEQPNLESVFLELTGRNLRDA